MLAGESLQLLHDIGRAAEAEVGVDPARASSSRRSDSRRRLLGVDEALAVEAVEGLPAPEAERRAEQPAGIRRVAGTERLPSEPAQALELCDVERATRDVEDVARRSRAQGRGGRLERRPELADVAVDDGRRGGRRLVAPDGVDQALGRDDLARVEQQEREQGSLLGSAEGLGSVAARRPRGGRATGTRLGGGRARVQRSPASDSATAAEPIHGRRTPLHPLDAATGPPPERRCNARRRAHCAPLRQFFVAASCTPPSLPDMTDVRREPAPRDTGVRSGSVAGSGQQEGRGSMDRKLRVASTIGAALALGAALVGPGGRHLSRRRRPARVRDDRAGRQQRHLHRPAQRQERPAAHHRPGIRRLRGLLGRRQAHRVLQQPDRRVRDLGDGQERRQPARRHQPRRLRHLPRLQPGRPEDRLRRRPGQ